MELSFQGVQEFMVILEDFYFQVQMGLILFSHGIKKDNPGLFLTKTNGNRYHDTNIKNIKGGACGN
jgi:hypothetical protein